MIPLVETLYFEIYNEGKCRNGKEVHQVNTDTQSHEICDENKPTQNCVVLRCDFPFENRPEYNCGKKKEEQLHIPHLQLPRTRMSRWMYARVRLLNRLPWQRWFYPALAFFFRSQSFAKAVMSQNKRGWWKNSSMPTKMFTAIGEHSYIVSSDENEDSG